MPKSGTNPQGDVGDMRSNAPLSNAMLHRKLPFIIGVIGDFAGDSTEVPSLSATRRLTPVDHQNFDSVLERLAPTLEITVDDLIASDGTEVQVRLAFRSLDDFGPARLLSQVNHLRRLTEIRAELGVLQELQGKLPQLALLLEETLSDDTKLGMLWTVLGSTQYSAAGPAMTSDYNDFSILDQIVAATPQIEPDRAQGLVKTLVEQALTGGVTFDRNLRRSIDRAIALIDRKISDQLNAIMHHPKFLKLEGSWRGLHYLVVNSETGTDLKIRMLNASKRELMRDLLRANRLEESNLARMVYDEAIGTPGGDPYGALVGDYEWTNHPEDIEGLLRLSELAAAAFAPFISGVSPMMFGLAHWQDLSRPKELLQIFTSLDYFKWWSFRARETSRFVCLVMPRVLARPPFDSAHVTDFGYEETPIDDSGASRDMMRSDYCWMSTAYILAARMAAAFAQHGCCTAIQGLHGGGAVSGLPIHLHISDDGDAAVIGPTESDICSRREGELAALGFSSLVHHKDTGIAAFRSLPTAFEGRDGCSSEPQTSSEVFAYLPCVMALCRIAHYIAAIGRDMTGSLRRPADLKALLDQWVQAYVVTDSSCEFPTQPDRPLLLAEIQVSESADMPERWEVIADLRPYLPADEVQEPVRLVVPIPALKRPSMRTFGFFSGGRTPARSGTRLSWLRPRGNRVPW